jgi:hypothetical protein
MLNPMQIRKFIMDGYVKLENVFSSELAREA